MRLLAAILLLTAVVFGQEHDSKPALTAKEMVEILADYDVKHTVQQPFYQPAYGVTNFDSTPPAVWIFETGDTVSRRSTVIHEFLHVKYHNLGVDVSEDEVRAQETQIYNELFLGH